VLRWLVTKLVKENETEENPSGFSEYTKTKQLIMHVVLASLYLRRNFISPINIKNTLTKNS